MIKRKRAVLPDFRPNLGIRAEYRAELNRLLRSARNDVIAEVAKHWEKPQPVAMDNATDILARVIDAVVARWSASLTDLPKKIAKRFVGQTKDAYDANLKKALRKSGFTAELQLTDYTREAMRASVGMNVGLIKSIPGE